MVLGALVGESNLVERLLVRRGVVVVVDIGLSLVSDWPCVLS
jgi:hypothetical protein